MRFQRRIETARRNGELLVQPRMGFEGLREMQQGLLAVRAANAPTVGTITLDSYTRVGDWASIKRSLAEGRKLNGFPIVTHGVRRVREMLDRTQSEDFPVQARHGSPLPVPIFRTLRDCRIDATEGGPVSYCLPYSRVPLDKAIDSWSRCAALAAEADIHLETFGGCMLGQMCPPAILLALSLLEALFFVQHGVRSVSLSYAQQTSFAQDFGALRALRRIAHDMLPGIDFHVVLYTYMGVFPRTVSGCQDLLRESVELARAGGVERLIVKTTAEAYRIPTVEENLAALELADRHWRLISRRPGPVSIPDFVNAHEAIAYEDALALVDAVLDQSRDIGVALHRAFKKGLLDIPYCLHPDNPKLARAVVDHDGTLQWNRIGNLPISPTRIVHDRRLDPFELKRMLSTMEHRFDAPYLESAGSRRGLLTGALEAK